MSNDDVTAIENSVSVISNSVVQIISTNQTIKDVQVHNILGQLLYKREVNSNNVVIKSLSKNNVTLIVKITLKDNREIVKKILY